MGNYNPHQPIILGQEWVPIREEDLGLSPSVNSVEVGHGFTLTTPRTLATMRYYENLAAPTPLSPGQVFLASVYRRGTEAATGPIRKVIIPVNNGGTTGSGITVNGGSVAAALAQPDDSAAINFADIGLNQQEVAMFFATNSYAADLNGKRILGVDIKYSFMIDPRSIAQEQNLNAALFLATDGNDGVLSLGNIYNDMGIYDVSSAVAYPTYGKKRLGEINQLWETTGFVIPSAERMPWNYTGLQRFEASAANRIHLHLFVQLNNPEAIPDPAPFATLYYAAMEVYFCEEQRIAVAGFQRYNPAVSVVAPGAFPMTARNNNGTFTTLPVLPAGDYTVTLSSPDVGDLYAPIQTFPNLNALREYYPIPPHPGVQVNIPAPVDDTKLGQTFSQEVTHVLPQLSLHTSGGPLTEVHVYGRQAVAQVYGTNVAEQNIYDDVVGTNTDYAQVRFYARRFGETTQALDFAGLNALSTSTASISVADFDNLDEILDGWKEVTLRLSTPAVMGTLVAPDPVFRWSSAAETAGNRWEILGAIAPALSGVPGNLFNKVPAPNQLGTATYQPTSGDTVLLKWMPGYSPVVTAPTDDSTADAVVLFSTDPPAISGFGVTMLTQPISGIGPDCGVDPCCIPTEIFYNQVTWTALSVPASGFGAYELQRSDDLTDWETIMLATEVSGSSFNDHEARVGLLSSYRIRALNVYNFAGSWSTTATETIDEPGVEIGCEGGHLLIFTSNSRQDGSINLAHSSIWDSTVAEDFDFPEAGDVVLQKMYGKNFVTAFRPLERGGERFTRTILVQAAAISAPTLGDFTALRDMAWDTVPYICVRDEDGNRWFATVLVPSGRVQLNRTLYMAPVTVIEVTDVPYPVDP